MPTEDEWADADAANDEEAGYHVYLKNPDEGVRRMRARIAMYQRRLDAVTERGDSQLAAGLTANARSHRAPAPLSDSP